MVLDRVGVMTDLFAAAAEERQSKRAPLADRLRPVRLDDIVGQDHLLAIHGSCSNRSPITHSATSTPCPGPGVAGAESCRFEAAIPSVSGGKGGVYRA